MSTFSLVPHCGSTPTRAVVYGHQTDAGDLCVAVASTEWGEIPGKAKDGSCWYSYGGKEHVTSNFRWLVAPNYALTLAPSTGSSGPPHGALAIGSQNDGSGLYYPAIAHTPYGKIPGKAQGNTCWYPYGGKEEVAGRFDWVVECQHC